MLSELNNSRRFFFFKDTDKSLLNMNGMMSMRERLYRFMQGRYGIDSLGRLSMGLLMIMIIVSLFWHNIYFTIVTWLLLVLVYFRMLSRNVSKRYAENVKFIKFRDALLGKNRDRAHIIFLCPSCKQKIRVPRGRGKIVITCPKCKKEFKKRT